MIADLFRRARPLWLGFALGLLSFEAGARGQTPDFPGDNSYSQEEAIRKIENKVNDEMTAGKTEEAMTDIDAAIAVQPKSADLHLFRAMLYARRKLWQRAEDDYALALKIDPNSPLIQYNMADLKFMQRAYDDARPEFAKLEGDPGLGDLATYQTYLCDLLSGDKVRAQQELDAFNRVRAKPSYFFANAAWELTGGHQSEAAKWFDAASHAYDAKTDDPYFTSLLEADQLDAPKVNFSTVDGTNYTEVPCFCEDAGLRVYAGRGWITIPYENLSDDLSGFPVDMQRTIVAKKQSVAMSVSDMRQVSFTTRDGRLFDHVNALIEGPSLRVQGVVGWESIPFSQLPADLSAFPEDWQKEILARDQTLLAPAHNTVLISFTTLSGKKYDQVRVFTGRTGLSVVTADGWETIPFAQLPQDLSVFPPDLRQEIVEWEKAQAEITPVTAKGETPPPEPTKTPPAWNTAPGRPLPFIQEAQDCRFGRCLALQGSRLVVGGDGATYVYENSELKARLCPDADQTGTGDRVRSVAVSGDTIVTSTPKGVYVWVEGPDGWRLQQELEVASPATVAIEGDQLVVGVDGKGEENGAVLFYLRQNGSWQPAKSVGDEGGAGQSADLSGRRIALQGTEAVIGFPNWGPGSRNNIGPAYAGHAWVKRWDGNAWQTETQLAPRDDGQGANQFGATVAFSGDLIAIASSNRDDNPHPGVVYLFQRQSGGWQPGAVLTSPDHPKTGGFGAGAMALSGGIVVVADVNDATTTADVRLSSGDDTGKPGTIRNAGIVYVYEDGKWQAPLMAPAPVDNPDRSGSPENFAASLALDGDTIAVGAPGSHDGRGAVYLWQRRAGRWLPAGELKGFHADYGLVP
jgi:Tfp pilus assembly protein PilF